MLAFVSITRNIIASIPPRNAVPIRLRNQAKSRNTLQSPQRSPRRPRAPRSRRRPRRSLVTNLLRPLIKNRNLLRPFVQLLRKRRILLLPQRLARKHPFLLPLKIHLLLRSLSSRRILSISTTPFVRSIKFPLFLGELSNSFPSDRKLLIAATSAFTGLLNSPLPLKRGLTSALTVMEEERRLMLEKTSLLTSVQVAM